MEVSGMAGHLIRRLHQISTHVFSSRMQEAGFDLTPVQFAALDALNASPGLDQAGIAAKIACDRATTGGVIDRLERKGLILRQVSKRDRRSKEVLVTTEGRGIYEKILPIASFVQSEILAGLDPKEREDFMRLAEKTIHFSDSSLAKSPCI